MGSSGSVTHWIGRLKAGDEAGAQKLWEYYFTRLVALARKKLQGASRRSADEEDVALSAFDSFCRGAGRGQYCQLSDRDNLWQLLVVITARKAVDLLQYERRQKRGGGQVHVDATPAGGEDAGKNAILEQVLSREPSPEFAAQVAEECQRLLQRLRDAELRQLALWKMEGYSNDEIAVKMSCVPRTIERRLRLIRSLWGREDV
jgi:DNA-directed RNA polymerase specialized sigma24 family protein